jgi:hypothetical protein
MTSVGWDEKQQIPFGDDNQKDNSNCNCNSNRNRNRNGKSNGKSNGKNKIQGSFAALRMTALVGSA